MGKKRKECASGEGSSSTPKKADIQVRMEDMPESYRRMFVLNREMMGFKADYTELLEWIRTLCSLDGSTLEGIRNVNWTTGFPLFEVDIQYGNMVRRFLISKMEVYMVAFFSAGSWNVFQGSGYVINGAVRSELNVSYKSNEWFNVGPRHIAAAIEQVENAKDEKCGRGLEKLIVFFCEAARFRPIQVFICNVFSRTSDEQAFNVVYDEELVDFVKQDGTALPEDLDCYNITKAEGPIDMNATASLPEVLQHLVKNWKKLSKVWYVYALTNRKYRWVDPEDVENLGIKNMRTVRSVLALLCNMNLTTLLDDHQKRIGKLEFTRTHYMSMQENLEKLKASNTVRT